MRETSCQHCHKKSWPCVNQPGNKTKATACLACFAYKVTCVPVGQESPRRRRVHKGRKAGKVSEAGSESEHGGKGEETEAETEGTGEVVQRLRILEQKANVSEVIIQTMARKTLGVGATRVLEGFAVALSSPVPVPSTMVQAQCRLETQVGVLRSLESDAWREFREHVRRLEGTEGEEEEAEESEEGSEGGSEESEDSKYQPSEESGEELGPEVEEEPEMEMELDTLHRLNPCWRVDRRIGT